jgi:hypothetical protein
MRIHNWRAQLQAEERKVLFKLDQRINILKRAVKRSPLKKVRQEQLDLMRARRHKIQMRASTRARRLALA